MASSSKAGFMRAVQWEGEIGDMSVNIVARPKIIAPEDALVRITSSAICGSDLHIYHGLFGSTPHGVGHEAVGIIEEVGPAVDFYKRGDRVVIVCVAEDGHLVSKTSLQPFDGLIGYGLGSEFGTDDGLQTEFVRVPWADSSLVKIPSTLEDKEWLPLADVFPTGWSALNRSGFQAGDTVAVFGAGGVGLMCAYSAIIRGASLVYVIDHVPARLGQAAAIGAMPINFTRGGKASEQILALRPGGVKRCVDCVGEVGLNDELKHQQDYILREAVKITSAGGGIGIAGIYMSALANNGQGTEAAEKLGLKAEISFPIAEAWFKGLQIQGGLVDIKDNVPAIAELIKNGRARPGFVFSSEYSLEDAPLAYRRFEKWEETKIQLKGNRKHTEENALEIRNGSGSGLNGASNGA
ncbi:hypothetical protein G7Z17_g1992 [Cylindrodendrum hubeiense]|uniref:Alcohol dehydrogenase-like N-terminal domain-containing protein n=1 Tax=Cylindrodendrum hubeiense TaxID=595255 RepID=A0A9P5LJL1_9HYPO|nr:hypothetical protein G7Z17_g1992 [Cylindrodendrum hubeiense]